MEAFLSILVIGFIVLLLWGLFEAVAPFIAVGKGILRVIWPFVIGCIIGIPLSIYENKAIGNIIVVAGLIGNIIWVKKL